MSFRDRLALFFVLIVIVPMLAVAFLLFKLIADSQTGQKEAGIAQQHRAVGMLFKDYRDQAAVSIEKEVGTDRAFTRRLAAGDTKGAVRRAEQLIRAQGLARILVISADGDVAGAGDRKAVAPRSRTVQSSTGVNLGTLEVSVVDAPTFAARAKQIASVETVVRNGRKTLASTLPKLGDRALPADTDKPVMVAGRAYRVRSFADDEAFTGQSVRVYTLGSLEGVGDEVQSNRVTAGGILLGFFLLAIVCAVLVSRSLQQQIASFLAVARRFAGGDFSAKVPMVGRDEFAALGEEFNKMSGELERRLVELSQERERVQNSMRRLGEAVASNLDRDALLELVVRTAVDGVGADAGRASVRANGGTALQERSRVGNMNGLEAAVDSVESDALRSGSPREATVGSATAIAHPLRGAGSGEGVVGVVSVGRAGRPFSPSDRDLFEYLAGQAARSLENVELHETAARESVTDELTGLSNRRAFDDALSGEIERSKRYGTGVALVLIDLDNFKSVNDTYGHPQGDLILREVARVLSETSREIDHPARYGGEELAVVLPGTDIEGAFNLAERVRERISGLRVPRLDGAGTMTVTTSCGVAAVPPTAAEERALVAAADAALYEAKRGGKNMSVRAR